MISYKVSQLVICKEHYEDEYEFREAIGKAVMLLLENDYIMTVQYDDIGLGIVVIEYEPNHPEWDCNYPYWLTPEEYEVLEMYKDNEGGEQEDAENGRVF